MTNKTQLFQQEYWQELKNFMEDKKSIIKIPNPKPKSWLNISMGKSGICLAVAVNSKTSELYIWLLLDGKNGKNNFDSLRKIAYKNSYREISEDLVWDRMDENIRSAVKLIKSANYTDKSNWVNQFLWYKVNLEKFDNFFKPLIAEF
jgi:hypothetical protein